MAYNGRGAAKGIVVAAFLLVVVIMQIETCNAAVGRSKWAFKMARWPRSNHFRAANVIAFNYDSGFRNVVVAENKAGYIRCIIPRDRLKRAAHYFICSIPGHCRYHNRLIPRDHNISGYIRCIIPRDHNRLKRVAHYFICSIPGHCQVG